MADLTYHQRQENEARQHRKRERGVARDLARDQAAGALDRLIAANPPDWFTPEQAHAYAGELRRLRLRLRAIGFDCYPLQNSPVLARPCVDAPFPVLNIAEAKM